MSISDSIFRGKGAGPLEQIREWDTLARLSQYRANRLAGLCQISLRTLERHFQKHYTLKVGEWLKELRMADAYEQLQSGQSVKEVAFSMGYKQHSHFTRDFKKRFGVVPSFLLPGARERAGILRLESPSCPQIVFTF